jgi:hypothetical protein
VIKAENKEEDASDVDISVNHFVGRSSGQKAEKKKNGILTRQHRQYEQSGPVPQIAFPAQGPCPRDRIGAHRPLLSLLTNFSQVPPGGLVCPFFHRPMTTLPAAIHSSVVQFHPIFLFKSN